MDELYLDNIDEFVNDHNKIVTYKWLSLTLGVHVNLAKQMLYHYLEQKRRDSSAQLHATYLVSGRLVENGQGCHKVSVVREDQLEDVKSRMSLTASVHVYSVQKAALKDSGPLYSVDYDAVKENLSSCSRYGAIRCADAVPRTPAEVQESRATTTQPLPPNTTSVKPAMNGHAGPPAKPAPKQSKGIMGMFASNKSAPKNPESATEVKAEQEDLNVAETSKSKPAAKTNSMANFFGKQATNKSEKAVKEKEEAPRSSAQPSPPVEKKSSPAEKKSTPAQASPVEKASPAAKDTEMEMDVKREQPKNKKDARSKTKRLDTSDEEEEEKTESQRNKKRRRIKKPQPDSDDDEVVPDSPRREVVKDASPSPSPEPEAKKEPISHPNASSDCKRRKRRRVLKSKTFVDEDGCIVTEKAYESESYSETEAEVQARKPASKPPASAKPAAGKKTQKKAAASANKSTKQASIMGFFQKK